jgi:endo-1,4-beta-xylanase
MPAHWEIIRSRNSTTPSPLWMTCLNPTNYTTGLPGYSMLSILNKTLAMKSILLSILGVLLLSVCIESSAQKKTTLRKAFKKSFLIGAAINSGQMNGRDSLGKILIANEFSSISPENDLKWAVIHPQPNEYKFETPDKYVALGEANKQFVIGHTLAWHSQVPNWVFVDDNNALVTKEVLYQRMKEHISTVAGRYKGRIGGWDVVNEALNDDGTMRNSKYYQIAGDEFIVKAFEYAHAADPKAELYYNDYNMYMPDKVKGAVRIVTMLKEKGLRVDAIGMQGHWHLNRPTLEEIENSILTISKAGVKVVITELDVSVLPNPQRNASSNISDVTANSVDINPYTTGLPDSMQVALANRYKAIFELFNKHKDKIGRVTFWGVQDGNSWKNNFPARGRTDYPLIFDREYKPKKAYYSILETVK